MSLVSVGLELVVTVYLGRWPSDFVILWSIAVRCVCIVWIVAALKRLKAEGVVKP